jgi:uncharacterized membrane protein
LSLCLIITVWPLVVLLFIVILIIEASDRCKEKRRKEKFAERRKMKKSLDKIELEKKHKEISLQE